VLPHGVEERYFVMGIMKDALTEKEERAAARYQEAAEKAAITAAKNAEERMIAAAKAEAEERARKAEEFETVLTEHRLLLRAAGYSPLPIDGKHPPIKKWDELIDVDEAEIAKWVDVYPTCYSTGALTQRMPTFDIDILDEKAAAAVEALVRDRYAESGRILVRIGRPPKRCIPFWTRVPFSKIQVSLTAPDGSSGQKLELLCDGQQVLIAGVHPDTGRLL
jgi:hypothetical protein